MAGRLVAALRPLSLLAGAAVLGVAHAPARPRSPAALPSPGPTFHFLVAGDNRGTTEILEKVVAIANEGEDRFLLHTGDFVDFATAEEWARVDAVLDRLRCPLVAVAGNHERTVDGFERSRRVLGTTFTDVLRYGPVLLVVLDSSQGHIPAQELRRVDAIFARERAFPLRYLATHTPPFDPRPGERHCLRPADAKALVDLASRHRLTAVFCAHVHLYHRRVVQGVPFYILAGAGAPLYGLREDGGFHHALRVTVRGTEATHDLIRIEPTPSDVAILSRFRKTWSSYYRNWLQAAGRRHATYRQAFLRYARTVRSMEARIIGASGGADGSRRDEIAAALRRLPPGDRAVLRRLEERLGGAPRAVTPK